MMSETHPPRHVLRSIGAVLAGFFATFILSIATDLRLPIGNFGPSPAPSFLCPPRSGLMKPGRAVLK
jgi:hypothetical protein